MNAYPELSHIRDFKSYFFVFEISFFRMNHVTFNLHIPYDISFITSYLISSPIRNPIYVHLFNQNKKLRIQTFYEVLNSLIIK